MIFSVLLIANFFVLCANFIASVLLCALCGKLWFRFPSCSFVSSVVKNGFGFCSSIVVSSVVQIGFYLLRLSVPLWCFLVFGCGSVTLSANSAVKILTFSVPR